MTIGRWQLSAETIPGRDTFLLGVWVTRRWDVFEAMERKLWGEPPPRRRLDGVHVYLGVFAVHATKVFQARRTR